MALIKKKELSTGVSGEYWKIHQLTIINDICYISLALYLNKAARLANKDIISAQNFTFDTGFAAADMDLKNPVKIGYEKIKANIDFADALND